MGCHKLFCYLISTFEMTRYDRHKPHQWQSYISKVLTNSKKSCSLFPGSLGRQSSAENIWNFLLSKTVFTYKNRASAYIRATTADKAPKALAWILKNRKRWRQQRHATVAALYIVSVYCTWDTQLCCINGMVYYTGRWS